MTAAAAVSLVLLTSLCAVAAAWDADTYWNDRYGAEAGFHRYPPGKANQLHWLENRKG